MTDPIREAAEDAVAELYGNGFANSGPRNRADETRAIEIIEQVYRAKLEAAVPAIAKALGEHYVGTGLPANEFECCEKLIRKAFLGGEE